MAPSRCGLPKRAGELWSPLRIRISAVCAHSHSRHRPSRCTLLLRMVLVFFFFFLRARPPTHKKLNIAG